MSYDQINPNNLISPREKYMRGTYFFNRNAFIVSGEPLVLHCNYYNILMLESVLSTAENINIENILTKPAIEVAYNQFETYFAQNILNEADKLDVISDFFKHCGFGILDVTGISEDGGIAQLPFEHFADNWVKLRKVRSKEQESVGFFAAGFLSGALAAAYQKPIGSYVVNQTKCKSKGDANTEFRVSLTENPNSDFLPSPAGGKLDKYHELSNPSDTKIDYLHIRKEMAGTAKLIANQNGELNAFGVSLTRMYANYYCLATYNWHKELEKQLGQQGVILVEELLSEMANQCAFYAMGGLMKSDYWKDLTKGCLETPEDYLHACIAFCNTFGWGFFEIADLVPAEKMIVKTYSGYESNCYLGRFGYNDKPVSFFTKGLLSGIMNLVYVGKAYKSVPALNQETYNAIFKSEKRFAARQLSSRTVGDKVDEIAVIPYAHIGQVK